MPELPEVETVRRGLQPVMEGAVFQTVTLNRPDLRFPFPADFISRIEGQTLVHLRRRAKFLDAELSSGDRLFMHLGMSGRFIIEDFGSVGGFVNNTERLEQHDHVIFDMNNGARIVFNDPRRFGFMELIAPGAPSRLDDLGPEPLSNQLNGPELKARFKGRKAKVKQALLDQRLIAGLGNIYVCEALYRAGISPRKAAGRLSSRDIDGLVTHIKDVISEAIEAGGSTLKDFANASGDLGYFQHSFDVYGREGEACHTCAAPILRIVQSGRSTFYCRTCQR